MTEDRKTPAPVHQDTTAADESAPDFSRAGAHRKGLSHQAVPVRACVLHPWLKTETGLPRDPETSLDEAVGLAAAIDLDIVDAQCVPLAARRSATLLGTGKVDELAGLFAALDVALVVINTSLTPVQQRNLEKAWNAKVLDRTGLILEIFGARARTREGRLQVELAHLVYQKSRLVRSWTHLERQRGGLGTVGGPGETQIEADRRLIQERITKIRRQLETVTRTRQLHRASRKKVPYPIVALVGYTNAGKSTLFNTVTQADVLAKDMLFATLDPSMRAVKLPSGRTVILSDTVGFISDLPTALVAAFRATLEEVLEADILLHVHDAASPETDAQAADVTAVLGELGIDAADPRPVIDVLNKADLLEPDRHEALARRTARTKDDPQGGEVLTSAQTGEGLDALLARIDRLLAHQRTVLDLDVASADGALLAWIHAHTEIMDRRDSEDGTRVRLRLGLDEAALGRLRKKLGETDGADARILALAAD